MLLGPTAHRIRCLGVQLAAAAGDFPEADGRVELMPALSDGVQAIVSFTGHAVVATWLTAEDLADLPMDGFGAALQPAVLQRLAGPDGEIGLIDATLVARGLGGGDLPVHTDLADHPRVRRAHSLRRDVRVFGDRRGLVTLGAGLAGRLELSVEAAPPHGRGQGRSLLLDALRLVPAGRPVFAAVSPGNARSLRALLGAGFVPVGSEVILVGARCLDA